VATALDTLDLPAPDGPSMAITNEATVAAGGCAVVTA